MSVILPVLPFFLAGSYVTFVFLLMLVFGWIYRLWKGF